MFLLTLSVPLSLFAGGRVTTRLKVQLDLVHGERLVHIVSVICILMLERCSRNIYVIVSHNASVA